MPPRKEYALDRDEMAALVRRAQAGDEAAYRQVLDAHGSAVSSTLVACGVRNRETAFDLAQEVALRVWTSLAQLDDPRAFAGWLRRITANVARDHLRRMARRREEALEEAFAETLTVESGEDPHQSAERASEVRRMLQALRLEDREVVRLLFAQAEGASIEELSGRTGLTRDALKMRLSRARLRLRKKLARPDRSGPS